MEFSAALSHVRCRRPDRRTDLAIESHRDLVGVRRVHLAIERHVELRIDHRHQSRVASGRRLVRHRSDRRDARRNRIELAAEHTLIEPPVVRAKHRAAARVELDVHAKARREHLPREYRAETFCDRVGFVAFRIDRRKVLADRAAVIEADPCIHRQPVLHADRIAGKHRRGVEQAARGPGVAVDRLQWRASIVDVLHASWNRPQEMVLAALDLRTDLEVVIGAERVREIPMEQCLRGDPFEHQRADLRGVAAGPSCELIAARSRRSIPRARIEILIQVEHRPCALPTPSGSRARA